jgi:hypothetical protein
MANVQRAQHSADEYLEQLKQSAWRGRGQPIRVDLRSLSAMTDAQATLVANGLLGSLGDVPLEIDALPDAQLSWLARTGLCFALANRTGVTRLSTARSESMALDAWRESWSPGTSQPLRELFSARVLDASEYVPKLFGPDHAAFVQPHLASVVAGGTEVTRVLRPWLLRMVGRCPEQDPSFVGDIGKLVEELVENVREHAVTEADGKPVCSLVDVSITRGGQGKRIRISVQDTGPGIIATVRAKLSPRLQQGAIPDVVLALVRGEAGARHDARGRGLPRVWDAVRQRAGARLWLATGIVRIEGAASGSMRSQTSRFDLAGTVVNATFWLP